MKIFLRPTLLVGLLSACAPTLQADPIIATCDVDQLTQFVGMAKGELDSVTLAVPVRWLPPGSAMTMDFSPDRINFELDGDDIILRAYCG